MQLWPSHVESIPTHVSDERLVLAKASPVLRNTHEIRLAIYFALKR
jgi:hypothetical protein